MINEHDIKDMWDAHTKKGWLEDQQKKVSGAMKFDKEKPRMELLDAKALEGLAQVLTFGAKKYEAHNWRLGLAYSRVLGAMLRHLSAIQRGEDIDPESGLPHINHVGCCWMFLSNYMAENRTELDDRWKGLKERAA